MGVVVTALGIFYLLAAALALRRVRMEWFLNRPLEKLSGKPESDRYRISVTAISTLLYGMAGAALVLRSSWAVWLLGSGLAMQALYYGMQWLQVGGEGDPERRQKAWSAGIISAAAFAITAYAVRIGVLA
jgi:hypothetical protein